MSLFGEAKDRHDLSGSESVAHALETLAAGIRSGRIAVESTMESSKPGGMGASSRQLVINYSV
jgi:hypothetical protein